MIRQFSSMLNYCYKQTSIHLKLKIVMFILKTLLIIEKSPYHSKMIISLCVCVYCPLDRVLCLNHEVVVFQPLTETTTGLGSVAYCYIDNSISCPSSPAPHINRFPSKWASESWPLSPIFAACQASAQYHMTTWEYPVSLPAYWKICYSTGPSAQLSVAHLWRLQPLSTSPVTTHVLLILALATLALLLSLLLWIFHCCVSFMIKFKFQCDKYTVV